MCTPRASGGDPNAILHVGNFENVLPAQAGVIPIKDDQNILAVRTPRASGGDPALGKLLSSLNLYSPRKRG